MPMFLGIVFEGQGSLYLCLYMHIVLSLYIYSSVGDRVATEADWYLRLASSKGTSLSAVTPP